MTVRIIKIDPSTPENGRAVSWDSSAADFVVDDVLDIQSSLGRHAGYTSIDVAAGAAITVRINSMGRRYPILPHAKRYGFSAPDLENEVIFYNENAITYTLAAGEFLEIEDIGVGSIQVTALTGTVVIIAR